MLNYKFRSSEKILQKFMTSASSSEVRFRGNKLYRQEYHQFWEAALRGLCRDLRSN